MTMVEIQHVWLSADTDNNKITLFGRPRISIYVDEYIWDGEKKKMMQESVNSGHL